MKNLRLKGFTLIELLIVIAIIGILGGIILVSLNAARQKASVAAYISHASGMLRLVDAAVQSGAFDDMAYSPPWSCFGDYDHPDAQHPEDGVSKCSANWGSDVAMQTRLDDALKTMGEIPPGQVSPYPAHATNAGGNVYAKYNLSGVGQAVVVQFYVGTPTSDTNPQDICGKIGIKLVPGVSTFLHSHDRCRAVFPIP